MCIIEDRGRADDVFAVRPDIGMLPGTYLENIMDWHELEKKKVTELRDMAKEKTKLEGVSGMSKEHLVEEIAKVMGIHKPHKVAHGQQKTQIKKQIRELKQARDQALQRKDGNELTATRKQLHSLKRQLRRLAELTTA
jgi:Rho termination factor, N-terminal domain